MPIHASGRPTIEAAAFLGLRVGIAAPRLSARVPAPAAGSGGFLPGCSLPRDCETGTVSAGSPQGERGDGARALPIAPGAATQPGGNWKVGPSIGLQRRPAATLAGGLSSAAEKNETAPHRRLPAMPSREGRFPRWH